jgi:uncharacterized oxidoreductase
MPLPSFIRETMEILGTDEKEILVKIAQPLRNNVGPNEGTLVTQFNETLEQPR